MSRLEQLREEMSQRSDAHLFAVVAHPEDWIPEAVQAARAEIDRRGLSQEETIAAEAIVQADDDRKKKYASMRLPTWAKVLIFLCPVMPGLMGILVIYLYFSSRGATALIKDYMRWLLYGLIFYAVLILILSIV